MARSKVSRKFIITIPKEIRKVMGLKPGDEVEIVELDGIIQMVRVRPLLELRGALKGMDISGLRDDEGKTCDKLATKLTT